MDWIKDIIEILLLVKRLFGERDRIKVFLSERPRDQALPFKCRNELENEDCLFVEVLNESEKDFIVNNFGICEIEGCDPKEIEGVFRWKLLEPAQARYNYNLFPFPLRPREKASIAIKKKPLLSLFERGSINCICFRAFVESTNSRCYKSKKFCLRRRDRGS